MSCVLSMNFYQSQAARRLEVISKYRDSQTPRIFTTCRATDPGLLSYRVSYFFSTGQWAAEWRQDTHFSYLKVIRSDASL